MDVILELNNSSAGLFGLFVCCVVLCIGVLRNLQNFIGCNLLVVFSFLSVFTTRL